MMTMFGRKKEDPRHIQEKLTEAERMERVLRWADEIEDLADSIQKKVSDMREEVLDAPHQRPDQGSAAP